MSRRVAEIPSFLEIDSRAEGVPDWMLMAFEADAEAMAEESPVENLKRTGDGRLQSSNHYIADWKPEEPIKEADLINDPTFQEQSKILYEKTIEGNGLWDAKVNEKSTVFGTTIHEQRMISDPKEIAKWAISQVTWLRNNDMVMIKSTTRLAQADPDLVVALANIDNMYDQTPTDTTQILRGTFQGLLSPTSLIGFGVIGAGIRQVAGAAGRHTLQEMASKYLQSKGGRALAYAGTLGASEGAYYAALSDYTNQNLYSEAFTLDPNMIDSPMDYSRVAKQAVVGAGIGAFAGSSLSMLGTLGMTLPTAAKESWNAWLTKRGGNQGGAKTSSQASAFNYAQHQESNPVIQEWNSRSAINAVVEKQIISEREFRATVGLNEKDASPEVKDVGEFMSDPAINQEINDAGIGAVIFSEQMPAPKTPEAKRALEIEAQDPFSNVTQDGRDVTVKMFDNSEEIQAGRSKGVASSSAAKKKRPQIKTDFNNSPEEMEKIVSGNDFTKTPEEMKIQAEKGTGEK
jgi:hypothetical protein